MGGSENKRSLPRTRDVVLAPLYITVGLGDVLLEKGRDRVTSLGWIVPTARRGRDLVDNLTERVTGRSFAEESSAGQASGTDGTDIPFGRGGAQVRAARRRTAEARAEADQRDDSGGPGERRSRSAAARASAPSPSPLGHRPSADEPFFAEQVTAARKSRPSGVEAASTLGRAARRAAARAEIRDEAEQ